MKVASKITKQGIARFAVVLAFLGIAAFAFAVPPNQLLRKGDTPVITGKCCFSWGESVTVTEPAQVTPVVVTWNADYQSNLYFSVGIAVNGHPCQVSDFQNLDTSGSIGRSRSFQWVVLPSDGLIKGNNTITLCGGGVKDTDTITLGFRTLAVTISYYNRFGPRGNSTAGMAGGHHGLPALGRHVMAAFSLSRSWRDTG